jgi:hypothetical protein
MSDPRPLLGSVVMKNGGVIAKSIEEIDFYFRNMILHGYANNLKKN